MSLLDRVAPVGRAGVGAVTGALGTAVRVPARTTTLAAGVAAGVAKQGVAAAEKVPRQAVSVARALADAHPRRTRRRVWQGDGHAQIEVRGATGRGPEHRRVSVAVRRALNALDGVRWAEINAVTGQVLVAFDEGRLDVGTLLETVRKVEEAHGTREADFSWDKPVHPSDNTPVGAALVDLAADYVAFWTAVSGRVLRVPAMPRGVRVTLTLLDMQPQLRQQLNARIGPVSTDVVMALTHSAVSGLSQRPIGPAISSLQHAEVLAEVLARRAVWNRRQADLCCTPEALPDEAPPLDPRPAPLPAGPLESWAAKVGPGTFGGALGVLALTREPRRGADTVLAASPRAARMGRESFASTAARQLAQRGVVPLDATAYRRLDRVSAVVLDSAALCAERPQILDAAGEHEDVRTVWREVNRLLRDHTVEDLAEGRPADDDGLRLERDTDARDTAPGAVPLLLLSGGRRLGRVTVVPELAPLAEAVVDAARATGARVLLTEHAGVGELLPRADETLPGDEPLARHVRRLQEAGHGVLCLSASDDTALAAADVGVGIIGEGMCACWSADLLCGPGLVDAWRLLQVTAAARPLTQRVVHLAQSATALGTLLALVGGKRGGSTHALAPVHSSALAGVYHGVRTASRATRGRAPAPVVHVPWHALEPADVLDRLADITAEPQERRRVVAAGRQVAAQVRTVARKPGPRHALAPARATFGITVAVREELQDPLTPVLALGAAASAVVGSVLDAMLVGTVLGGNAVISGAQRYHAEQALQKLMVEQTLTTQRLRRTPEARDAARTAAEDAARALETLEPLPSKPVRAPRLVPGDIIVLRATDVVPADARLLVACDLEVDESSLTGESVPVHKDLDATPGARLPDRTCMVFDGTTVLAGTAYAVVVATGDATEAARASRAAGAAAPAAGVQARLAEVTRLGLPATGVGGVAVAGIGLLRGLPLRESIAAGVSVAVAAVPEGLPLVATMAQAGAARRLSKRGVLVRSSRTLEALGRVDTVCFDKTGTLTEGRLRVSVLATADGEVDAGEPAARRLLEVATRACPDVADEDIAGVAHAEDRALLEAAVRSEHAVDREKWEVRCESPFEATRGYAASLGVDAGDPLLAVKGAPEVLLELCSAVATGEDGDDGPMSDEVRRTAERTAKELAEAGLRVLAVAERRSELPEETEDLASLVCDLTLVGFVGIADPPRDTAEAAVAAMVEAGIRPVMITGDHPATACAIARAVGLPSDRVVTGDELEGITEQERVSLVAEATVFARVSPEQKVRIVEALRAADRVVMMTGDGTNDAAAIRLADVGIGVGADASAAARSSADLVLAEPDLPRIHDALLEGRAMWHRMQAAVSILVGGNAGEMAFMTLGTAVAGRAPINIRQMLLVNLLTDMLPALAVAVAPLRDPDQANAPVESALGASLARAVAVRGTTTTLGATLAWTAGRYTGRRKRADTMGLAALVGTQLGQTLMVGWRSPLVVATSVGSAGVMFVIVETPGVSQLFGCTPVGPFAWTIVAGSSAVGTLAAAAAPRVLPD